MKKYMYWNFVAVLCFGSYVTCFQRNLQQHLLRPRRKCCQYCAPLYLTLRSSNENDIENEEHHSIVYPMHAEPARSFSTVSTRRNFFGIVATTAVVVCGGPSSVIADTTSSQSQTTTSTPRKTHITNANFTSLAEPTKTKQHSSSIKKQQSNSSSKLADKKKTQQHHTSIHSSNRTAATKTTEFKQVNLTKVANENTINITMYEADDKQQSLVKKAVYVDRKDFTRVTVTKLPKFIPKFLRPKTSVEIPNSQLLLAAIIAGSLTEAIRTTALYPLATIKTRIQGNPKHQRARTWKRKIQSLYLSFIRHYREGDLYAGIVPSLLVTVPASGIYCGVRDVTNRMLQAQAAGALTTPFADIEIKLIGAFIADVVSLAARTPADVFATRLQVVRMLESNPNTNGTTAVSSVSFADSLRDGIDRLPAVIITDLPYLLLRLFGNWVVTNGQKQGLGEYEIETIIVACVCAALTTPYDVARTRILINDDSGDTERQRERSKRRNGVWRTMKNITQEGVDASGGGGGIQNLYAGWIERTMYFGIGRAWFDPIRFIGYLGIRDAILLRWFR